MPDGARQEVRVSVSRNARSRRPVLHYVSDAIEENESGDDAENNFAWARGFMRGWFRMPANLNTPSVRHGITDKHDAPVPKAYNALRQYSAVVL